MRYVDLHEQVPGIAKQALTQFFARHIARSVPVGIHFHGTSLAKRIVGNVLRDFFYLRNAASSRDKHKRKKIDDILRPQIRGAVKAMAVDHPEVMNFDHEQFVETLLDRVVVNANDLYSALSY
jgi:hypothetical protein